MDMRVNVAVTKQEKWFSRLQPEDTEGARQLGRGVYLAVKNKDQALAHHRTRRMLDEDLVTASSVESAETRC